jgi:hypothetical protein
MTHGNHCFPNLLSSKETKGSNLDFPYNSEIGGDFNTLFSATIFCTEKNSLFNT